MEETSLPSPFSGDSKAVNRTIIRSRKATSTVAAVPKLRDSIPAANLSSLINSFLIVGDISRHSAGTLESRRYRLGRLLWLAERDGWKSIGVRELQQFFLYLIHGHKDEGGRWGNPQQAAKAVKAGTSKTFHSTFRTFFRWLVKQGEIDICPMDKIDVPVDRPDQIQPFTDGQMVSLLAAAKKTHNPLRDTAIIYVLMDCGLRVSELTTLQVKHVDFTRNEITVQNGKGGKARYVPYGRNAKHALWTYCQAERRQADGSEPLFLSERGPSAGANFLTRRGISLLIKRLGAKAGITGVRCSPHTFRHYFGKTFASNNGNVFGLMAALGHTDLDMTNRYVKLAQADLTAAHRISSPGDRLRDSKGGR